MYNCPTFEVYGDPQSCPYLMAHGKCQLENPRNDCDDYYALVGDEDREDDFDE